ncbi:MAG: twin-arginine translocase TatA/TatE family subunit [Synergistaceae bacterium]|nr:twin-arginine translocase TatA/TatE family subunit [Synergistaceae bacterium]MBQ7067710.1 twin-arginine translocase TatA/TatE family subunit [Synergistaceae bacterium]MBR0074461.1 twin-arginine translocase TatA/TatE family subunit [Synergistaceae bacterium]MBR0080119.1 twin-arginine translocase TatA/TatE family subunit [Synergistaceae bacterium]MBR0253768.1 twin-arginine translocase TatA/TatE family subunit [Synergistaceae bacterium]
MHLGITEILLLIFLALVLFGGSKLSGVGKALGRSIRDFKTELRDSNPSDINKEAEEVKA